ncbi:unnamed protein product [Caenorhabditis brenneri]
MSKPGYVCSEEDIVLPEVELNEKTELNETVKEPEPNKGKAQRVAPTECRICFRPAHGHHCGVASCKACKTFFRRICVSDLELHCKWEKKCFEDKGRTSGQQGVEMDMGTSSPRDIGTDRQLELIRKYVIFLPDKKQDFDLLLVKEMLSVGWRPKCSSDPDDLSKI